MSQPSEHSPPARASASDRAFVKRLLEAARATPAGAAQAPEASEYDWNAPRAFTPEQVKALCEFANRSAERIAADLGALLRSELRMNSQGVAQVYARDLRDEFGGGGGSSQEADEAPQAGNYLVALETTFPAGREAPQCGLLVVSAATGAGWVDRLLGGGGGHQAGREPSPLEAALLLDAVACIGETFSALVRAELEAGGATQGQAASSWSVRPRGEVHADAAFLPADDTEVFCRFDFRLGGDEENDPPEMMALILPAETLQPIVAGASARAGAGGPDQTRKAMLEHLQQVTVPATAWVGTACLRMRDVMALEAGDVMVLEKGIDEPIDLQVQGRTVLSGFLVQCSGRYGLLVAGTGAAGTGPSGQPGEGSKERT